MNEQHENGLGPRTSQDARPGLVALVGVVAVLTPPLFQGARDADRPRVQPDPRAPEGPAVEGTAHRRPEAAIAARSRASVRTRSSRPSPFLLAPLVALGVDPDPTERVAPVPPVAAPPHRTGLEPPGRRIVRVEPEPVARSSAPRRYLLAPKGSPPA